MYVCMYACMYVCMYVYIYVCMYVSLYICMYVRMYVCIYVSMYTSSRLTDESIHSLCNNLSNTITLNSLNLNYCQLSSSCGEPLGYLAATTQLR